MSGAEFSFVIGLVSGTITVLDTLVKAFKAAQHGCAPEAFGEVTERLSLVQETLRAVERRMAESGPDDEPDTNLRPVIQSCRTKVGKLQVILDKSVPQPSASTARRCIVALRAHSRAQSVGKLARAVLEDMQLIAQRQAALGGANERQVRGALAAAGDVVPLD